MSIEHRCSDVRAPEERNVYSKSESPQVKTPAERQAYQTALHPQVGHLARPIASGTKDV